VSLWEDELRTPLGRDGARQLLSRDPDVRYEVEATAPGFMSRRIPLVFRGGADEVVTMSLMRDPAAPPAPTVGASGVGASGLKDPFRGARVDPLESRASGSSSDLLDPFRKRSADGKGKGDDSGKTAVLRIGTDTGASPAMVYVDGTRVGFTPLKVKVTPGRHTVKWVWPDSMSSKTTITLEAGESEVVKGSPPAG
jgi:hypothetical protein